MAPPQSRPIAIDTEGLQAEAQRVESMTTGLFRTTQEAGALTRNITSIGEFEPHIRQAAKFFLHGVQVNVANAAKEARVLSTTLHKNAAAVTDFARQQRENDARGSAQALSIPAPPAQELSTTPSSS